MTDAQVERLRRALKALKGIGEKRMFGGVCFLLRGNMLCGTGRADYMFRIGREQDAEALSRTLVSDLIGRIPFRVRNVRRVRDEIVEIEPSASGMIDQRRENVAAHDLNAVGDLVPLRALRD